MRQKLIPIKGEDLICRGCQSKIILATNTNQHKPPATNDWMVCVNCGTVSLYDEVKGLSEPTKAQLDAFKESSPYNYTSMIAFSLQLRAAHAAGNDNQSKMIT